MKNVFLAVITAITAAAIMAACGAAPAPSASANTAAKPTQVVEPKTTQPTQVVAQAISEVAGFEFEGVKFGPADLQALARSQVRRDKAREELMIRLKNLGCFTYACVLVEPGYGFDKWSTVQVNGSTESLVRGDASIEYMDGGYNEGPVDESVKSIQVKASTLKEKDTSFYLTLVVLNSYGDPIYIVGPVDEVVEAALHL